MIQGKILTANLGNVLPTKSKYTFSLSSSDLAEKISKKIHKESPDVLVLQEVWDFTRKILGKKYDFLGLNDSIAVKKSFGRIKPDSFRSHAVRFKKSLKSEIYPNKDNPESIKEQKELLERNPYTGSPNSAYGIPVDFDLMSLVITTQAKDQDVLIGNAHLRSGPWNSEERSAQITSWIIEDLIPRAESQCEGRLIIAGDFNHDEDRQKGKCSRLMRELSTKYDLNDAARENTEVTTNYPFFIKDYRCDHIFGTVDFSEYRVSQSLLKKDFTQLKRRKPLTWWMHLDHKMVSANFKFEN